MSHIRHAFRQLALRPALSAVVILMLGVGIGITTAFYSMFHQVLMRPLPVPEPARLVNLTEPGPKTGRISCTFVGLCGYEYVFSYPMFRDLEVKQTTFTGIAAQDGLHVNLAYGEQRRTGLGVLVSGGYFGVLKLKPALGRLIAPQDAPRVGESTIVVLSYGYWQSDFGGDPKILGKTLTVNGQRLTIIGVAPAGFSGTTTGQRPQVFVPVTLRWLLQPTLPRDQNDRRSYWLHLFARLKPGVTTEQASAAINGLHHGILRELEASQDAPARAKRLQQRRIALEPGARGQSSVRLGAAQPLTLLLGITLVVLLIVCVNIANLLLARGASRSGEMAIRASIGASRRQLLAQLLAELGLLAALGAALSLPVAAAALGIVTAIMPAGLADGLALDLDPTATAFAVTVSVVTVLAFGLAPALRTARANLGLVLKGYALQSAGGRGLARGRAGLVTAQIAFSTVLLVLAGLFAQSLFNVARVDLGIDVDSLMSFQVSPRLNGYGPQQAQALYDRIERELAAQPGVTGVTSAAVPLLAGQAITPRVSLRGFEPAPGVSASAALDMVGSGFFQTLGIPLRAGRGFTGADTSKSTRVAAVNETFLRRFNLRNGALGRHFSTQRTGDVEIVGVVADTKYSSITGRVPPQFFVPRRQVRNPPWAYFYVRAGIKPEALARMIRHVVTGLDPNLPVSNLTTMKGQIRDDTYLDRLVALLSAGFAGLATLLAAIGLYGVLAYSVTQRTRELGLRLALGADAARLRTMVLKQVALMGLAGGLIGLAAAVAIGRVGAAMLFGLSGYDPVALTAALTVMAVVVLGASYLPARRASNIEPMEALRYQ